MAVYDLSMRDMVRLDVIEGLGRGYAAGSVEVPGFGSCATYLPEESHIDPSLAPYDWYKNLVLLGCRALGFPGTYSRSVADVAHVVDPHPERSRSGWDTVAMLRNGG